jgi:hypothetical protein
LTSLTKKFRWASCPINQLKEIIGDLANGHICENQTEHVEKESY